MADSSEPRLLLDTTVYIDFLVGGVLPPAIGKGFLYASSVVMEELYAGARAPGDVRMLDRLFRALKSQRRLVTPTSLEWRKAGLILAGIGKSFGFESIGRARMTNDVLIALSASRIGAVLYTGNAKDFRRIQRFLEFEFVETA